MKLQKPSSGLPNIERLFIKNFFVPILRTFLHGILHYFY